MVLRDTFATLDHDGIVGAEMIRRFVINGDSFLPTSVRCVVVYKNSTRPVAANLQPRVELSGATITITFPAPAIPVDNQYEIYFNNRKVIGGRLRFVTEGSLSPVKLPDTIRIQTQDGVDVNVSVLIGASDGGVPEDILDAPDFLSIYQLFKEA